MPVPCCKTGHTGTDLWTASHLWQCPLWHSPGSLLNTGRARCSGGEKNSKFSALVHSLLISSFVFCMCSIYIRTVCSSAVATTRFYPYGIKFTSNIIDLHQQTFMLWLSLFWSNFRSENHKFKIYSHYSTHSADALLLALSFANIL